MLPQRCTRLVSGKACIAVRPLRCGASLYAREGLEYAGGNRYNEDIITIKENLIWIFKIF
jgi:hypothetical protein